MQLQNCTIAGQKPSTVIKPFNSDERARLVKAGLLGDDTATGGSGDSVIKAKAKEWKGEEVPGPKTAVDIIATYSGAIQADPFVAGIIRRTRANAGISDDDTGKVLRWYHKTIQ